jgi:hypothetical protein
MAALGNSVRLRFCMTLLLQSAVFIVATLGALLLLAAALSRFGGVGMMELWLLLGPALIAGVWMARQAGRIGRRR